MFRFGRKKDEAEKIVEEMVVHFSTDEEEVNDVDGQKQVEDLMEEILDRAFMTASPNDGSLISAVRTTELFDILCKHFGVNGKETAFSDYAS